LTATLHFAEEEDMQQGMSVEESSTANEGSSTRKRKLSLQTKLAFSSGGFQEAAVAAAGMTTLLFYNQILGVSASLCGVAFLIASVVDAVSDPLVGALSDRFDTRWGRRHPYMLVSAFPLAVSFYLLYQPMRDLSETGTFIWLTSFLVLMRLSITFYNIPHDALGAELTDDYHERTSLFGYNWVITSAATMLMVIFVLWVLFPTTPEYSTGLLNEGRYPLLAGIGAVVVFTAIMGCTFGTRNQIPFLHQASLERTGYREFSKNLLQLLINPSYLAVCVSWLTLAAALGILGMVSTYTYLYAYEISSEQLSLTAFAKLPGILVALPLATLMTRRLDKKRSFIIASLVSASIIASPHLLRMYGVFPGSESLLFLPLLFGPLFLGYMILPVMNIVVDSQLVDICDDHEYKTGVRAEGVVFSIRTFAMKSTIGLGAMIGGFGLDLIGFPQDAVVGELAPRVVNGLLFMSGPLYLMIVTLGIAFMLLYRLNAKRHQDMLDVLEKRRAANKTE
jgi:Na+/melibiose symporter-like transporter